MIRRLTLATLLLAAAAPVALIPPAFAQEDRDDDRDRDEDRERDRDRDRDDDRERDRDRDRDERRGDREERRMEREERREMRGERMYPGGPHHRGMHGRMGPAGASFRIEMGEGRSIVVRCGSEPLVACVEAATPLLDMVEGAGAPMAPIGAGRDGELPPPPASLAPSGETPPPPPPAN